MSPSPPAFRLEEVTQVRDGITALDRVTLEFPAGEISALIGPSGSGKSALLRLLNRLDDPVSGTIQHHGKSITEFEVRELRRRVGYVFQAPVPFEGTVRDNLVTAATLGGVSQLDAEERIRTSIGLADLDRDLLDRPAHRLSGGQLQRLAIARALMTAPETLVMDEPTAALDPETAANVGDTVTRLSRDGGLTVVMATHRLKEAQAWCPFVAMLDQGRLIEAGPATQLFVSDHPRVKSFLSKVS